MYFLILLPCVIACNIIVGIPTTSVRGEYIHNTIASIVAQKGDVHIVILLINGAKVHIPRSITYISTIVAVLPPPILRRTNFGDSITRIQWRSNMVSHHIQLLSAMLARPHNTQTRFIRLEDDSILLPDAFSNVCSNHRFASIGHQSESHGLQFLASSSGLIFLVYDVRRMIDQFTDKCDVAPLDWMIGAYMAHECHRHKIDPCLHGTLKITHAGTQSSRPMDDVLPFNRLTTSAWASADIFVD